MIDLKFTNVSKRYFIQPRISGKQGNLVKRGRIFPHSGLLEFWALRDVSFEVQRGEALGIIGCNGAGKSTALKLLSRVSTPTHGEILINGRLSALIEVGSGFHPELTGRENIYLSGSIHGMRRREITAKLDSIVDFSEIKDFIDTPVKRYSSGMYLRLGFAIAAHLDPDILVLDEVLAVGDASFQSKCLERIRHLRNAGTTIIFVSHHLEAVQLLCDRVLLLQGGRMVANGPAQEIIELYTTTASAPPLSQTNDPLCLS
jgi:lipopolysaccharide transport system ATP-binding protein